MGSLWINNKELMFGCIKQERKFNVKLTFCWAENAGQQPPQGGMGLLN